MNTRAGGGEERPLVSFIMPFYNETEEQARESIESALNQTYDNIQIVMVLDNPGNSGLRALITRYADEHDSIVPVFNSANMGVALSRNEAVKRADGEYLAMMDADDISFPGRVEAEVAAMISGNLDLVAANTVIINEAGENHIHTRRRKIGSDKLRKVLPRANPIQNSTVLMRASMFRALGGYRDVRAFDDYDMWLRFLTAGARMQVLGEALAYYRVRDGGLTRSDAMFSYVYADYFVKLYRERIAKGSDSHSKQAEKDFFTERGYYDLPRRESFNRVYLRLTEALNDFRAHKSVGAFFSVMKTAVTNGDVLKWLMRQSCSVFVWHKYSDRVE